MQAATAAALGLIVWWIAASQVHGSAGGSLSDLGRYVGAELFVVAGVLRVVCWRATRYVQDLRDGIGLAAIGLSMPALAILAPWPIDATAVDASTPLTRLFVFAPIMLLLGAVPVRSTVRAASALFVLAAVVVAVAASATATSGATLAVTVESGLALGWLAVGVRALTRRENPSSYAVSLVVLAAAAAWRAETLGTHSVAPTVAVGFGLVAAALAVFGAVSTLRRALRALHDEGREMSHALLETRQILARTQSAERERLHDARSAVFGVIGASQLLHRSRPPVSVDRDSLQQMIFNELGRLQTVLDAEAVDEVVDFDLAEALATVLLAHRLETPGIVDHLEHVLVSGRPGVMATVLDNLLRNASTHAPGAAVLVRCEIDDERVRVVVEDDGPGIPAPELDAVLFPGIRATTARGAGSGLGLSNCVRAMASQDGQLRLTARPGGGTRVSVTLPVAAGQPTLVGSR